MPFDNSFVQLIIKENERINGENGNGWCHARCFSNEKGKFNLFSQLTQRHNPSTLSNVVFNLSVASGQRFRIDPNRIPYRVIL